MQRDPEGTIDYKLSCVRDDRIIVLYPVEGHSAGIIFQ